MRFIIATRREGDAVIIHEWTSFELVELVEREKKKRRTKYVTGGCVSIKEAKTYAATALRKASIWQNAFHRIETKFYFE